MHNGNYMYHSRTLTGSHSVFVLRSTHIQTFKMEIPWSYFYIQCSPICPATFEFKPRREPPEMEKFGVEDLATYPAQQRLWKKNSYTN
jgi:hypothetical protein